MTPKYPLIGQAAHAVGNAEFDTPRRQPVAGQQLTDRQLTAFAHAHDSFDPKLGTPPTCRTMMTKGKTTYTTILTIEEISEHEIPKQLTGWHWHASVARWVNNKHFPCKHLRHKEAALSMVNEMFAGVGHGLKYKLDPGEMSSLKAVHFFKPLTDKEISALPGLN